MAFADSINAAFETNVKTLIADEIGSKRRFDGVMDSAIQNGIQIGQAGAVAGINKLLHLDPVEARSLLGALGSGTSDRGIDAGTVMEVLRKTRPQDPVVASPGTTGNT